MAVPVAALIPLSLPLALYAVNAGSRTIRPGGNQASTQGNRIADSQNTDLVRPGMDMHDTLLRAIAAGAMMN